jgi:pyruvate/2-oxoglutarate dehydrogenase complex dihydrolipoamide dehydrogenase (E3) component
LNDVASLDSLLKFLKSDQSATITVRSRRKKKQTILFFVAAMCLSCLLISLTLLLGCFPRAKALHISASVIRQQKYGYDVIIIGAGASGMFAAGTAASFGCKTLLIEKIKRDCSTEVGGDCSNSACVPSKAMRSAAQVMSQTHHNTKFTLDKARDHVKNTVSKVRNRDSPQRMRSSENLDLLFVSRVSFDSKNQLTCQEPNLFNSTYMNGKQMINDDEAKPGEMKISAKKFIIATGAGPAVPKSLEVSAKSLNVPVLTYRSFFRPDGEGLKANEMWNMIYLNKTTHVVLVGGGPTSCEVGQTLARMTRESNLKITIVAPTILGSEDVAARNAARRVLNHEGIKIMEQRRAISIQTDANHNTVVVLDDDSQIPVDILFCATGRTPNLKGLHLDKANIVWDDQDGILVNSRLQSISQKNVFAAGDCASIIPKRDRRAAHAGWTGYHAAQSAIFPRLLVPKHSVHPFVPRITFLHPEIASIGMTRVECVAKYGQDGFRHLKVEEKGTDRSDIDSISRFSNEGFVELRVAKRNGEILGCTICAPCASEIVNELGVVMMNKLTVRDVSKSIHAYPSHGYLMHRVALAMALSDIWGILAACGTVGRVVGDVGRTVEGIIETTMRRVRKKKSIRHWESMGADKELLLKVNGTDKAGLSFLDASNDSELSELLFRKYSQQDFQNEISERERQVLEEYINWFSESEKKISY